MKEDKYTQASLNLSKAIDIAIESLHRFPPEIWDKKTINHVENCYNEWKNNCLNPELKFRNLKSLSYVINDTLTYFQESSGEDVNYFWDKINSNNLPFKRENKLSKILKRKKIINDIELDFIIDVIIPYQQEGLINEDDVILLNKYIADFEMRSKKLKSNS